MTAPVPLVERLAEHEWLHGIGKCLCGWEPTYPESMGPGDTEVGMTQHRAHVARALLPVVEQAVAEARGEALWQATNDWQWGQWTVLTEPIKATADNAQRIIGAAQAVTDWLRNRSDAITTTEETP